MTYIEQLRIAIAAKKKNIANGICELAEDDAAEAPVYDPRVSELAQDDAEFGPGVNQIKHNEDEEETNRGARFNVLH